MTQQEETRLRLMISDLISIHSATIDGQFKIIDEKLDRIEIQANKTNGTVIAQGKEIAILKEANLTHVANCPLDGRLKIVEADRSERKSISKFIKVAATVIIGAISLAVAVKELILN